MFKFHQWPFSKDEVVKLLWIKSPYKGKNNEWISPLLFLDKNDTVVEIDINWATLPFLRLGQFYINGLPTDMYHQGNIMTLNLDDVSEGSICDSSVLPDQLFQFKTHIAGEKIWRFETQGNVVFIPCIELIRAFFASNSRLAKALLEQNGLDYLIPSFEASDDWVHIKLDYNVPGKIITEDFVQQLAWIKFDKLANRIWCSVLSNIFPRGDIEPPLILFPEIIPEKELGGAKKIKMIPPIEGPSTWEVRALSTENTLYILELMGVSNLIPPYQKITYSHQKSIRKQTVDSTLLGSKRKARKRELEYRKKDQKIIVNENPAGASNVSILKIKPMMMRFSRKTQLEKERQYKQVRVPSVKELKPRRPLSKRERREKEIREYQEKLKRLQDDSLKPSNSKVLFSSMESSYLGNSKVFPMEIIGIKISNTIFEDGLKQFEKMVDILRAEEKLIILPLRISTFPSNRSFAFKEDGTPRRYAIAEIQFDGRSYYLLEVERLSKEYLATLIIQSRAERCFESEKLNNIIRELLFDLIENHGNWKVRKIENYDEAKIYRVKHLEEWTLYDWADIILDRLNLL